MPWFVAHVVMAVHYKDGKQDTWPVWDNIHLVEANDAEGADLRATQIGRSCEGDSDGTFEWDDRPAEWKFVGVRKIVTVSNSASPADELGDGAELTYQTFEVNSKQALDSLMVGEPVLLRLIE